MSQYINEAFKKFRLLEDYEEFSITPEGLDNLGSFMGQALDDESVDVIDLEAEAQEDLKKSYVGKVICDCNVCHSNIFFNKEDIVIGEDGIVNAEDECPYCMSNDGYTIIGEIQAYDPGLETEIDTEVSDDELADEPIEIEDEEETEVVEEGLKRKSKKRKLTEGYNLKRVREIEKEINADFSGLSLDEYDEDNRNIYLTVGDAQGNIAKITIPKRELDETNISYCVFSHIEDAIDDGELLEEGLKLDGVKSLRGTKGLKKRPDKLGVKSLRGLANSKISGTTLEESISKDDIENWLGEHETATKDIERFYKKSLDKLSKDEMLDWIEEHKQLSNDLHRHFNESIEDVTINTEDETMTMTTKEDGGVVVETSPREDGEFYDDFDMDVESDDIDISDDVEAGDEIIAPLSDETEEEIINNSEESEPGFEEETIEDETFEEEPEGEDVEVDEFDEETFDGLGESYLRRCYENVKGYKTTQVRVDENLLKVDGVITFKSGAQKKTNFVFEAKEQKNKRFIFEGYNTQINKGKRAFRLNCSIQNKKVIPMTLKYNYSGKNALNESVKLTGVVKSKRK